MAARKSVAAIASRQDERDRCRRTGSRSRAASADPTKPVEPVSTTRDGGAGAFCKGRKAKRASREMPVFARQTLGYGQVAGVAVMVSVTAEVPSVTVTAPSVG